jgi:hypothetical protein
VKQTSPKSASADVILNQNRDFDFAWLDVAVREDRCVFLRRLILTGGPDIRLLMSLTGYVR